MYPTIISHGIPRPNEGIHNQALQCISPLLVKGFLSLVVVFLRPPHPVSKPSGNPAQPGKRTPSHHGYPEMARQG